MLQQHVQKFAEWHVGLQARQQMQQESHEQQRAQAQSTIQELRAQLRGAQQALSEANDSAQQARDKAQVHTAVLHSIASCQVFSQFFGMFCVGATVTVLCNTCLSGPVKA